MIAATEDPRFIRLATVLQQERELLLTGQAARVAELVEEKMSALQDFESFLEGAKAGVSPAGIRTAIDAIIQFADENAVHLEAVRNGIRSAISRLEGIAASTHVGYYRRNGAQISFTNATGAFNRKA